MWRRETFMEIQQLVLSGMTNIKAFDLYNNQDNDYEAEQNRADHLPFPHVLLEFVGGDWEHDGERRTAQEYFFRLHLMQEDYRLSHSVSNAQQVQLEHLDQISTLANVLDHQNLTHATNFEFLREEIDTSRTNLIHHRLDFVARVEDCSLYEQNKPDQVEILFQQPIVTVPESQVVIPPAPILIPAVANMQVWLNPQVGFTASKWVDQSGNTNDFIQPVTSRQPILSQTGINGAAAVLFDGSKYMQLLNRVLANDMLTIHLVMKIEGNSTGAYGNPFLISAIDYANAGTTFMQLNTLGNTFNINMFNAALDRNNLAGLDTQSRLFSIIKSPTGVDYRIDGVSVGFNTGIQNINNASHFIGSWSSNFANMMLGDVLIYDTAQTGTELQQTIDYLLDKYQL